MSLSARLSLATLVCAALAAALAFVPLFNLLDYEFCFALTPLGAIGALLIGDGAARTHPRALPALGLALTLSTVQLLPALAIISLNALRVPNCDFGDGLGFFLCLPAASAWYGAGLGVLTGKATLRRSRRVRYVTLLLFLLAPLAASLWALYWQPPIFVFDHLWGYFSGSLYDESVRVDGRLLLFRLGTGIRLVAIGLVLFAIDRRAILGRGPIFLALVAGLTSAAAYDGIAGPRFGFRVTQRDIEARLSQRIERKGLVIHLPPGVDAKTAQAIADDHAFRLWQLSAKLGIRPRTTIHSYVYADAEQKRLLMGGRNTMVSKPWLHQIHIHDAVAPHPVLAHELAHALLAELAPGPLHVTSHFGVLVNMALVEGAAEALSPPSGDLDLHSWARALRQLGLAPELRTLLGPAGFWSAAPRRAYAVAGSFTRYLLSTYGPRALARVYRDGDFSAAYHKPLANLVADWERFLDSKPVSADELALAQEHFRTPSIFARTCAHEIAELREAATHAPPKSAVRLYRRICNHLGKSDVAAKLDLALAERRAGNDDDFLQLAEELLANNHLTPKERDDLLAGRGLIAWKRGALDEAAASFRTIMQTPGCKSDVARLQWVRLWALQKPAKLQDTLRRFLSGELSPVVAVAALEEARHDDASDTTFPYLIGRQLFAAKAYGRAQVYLELAAGHPFSTIDSERTRLLAECYERQDKLDLAIATWQVYATHAPSSGESARAHDHLARLRWQAQRSVDSPNEASYDQGAPQ